MTKSSIEQMEDAKVAYCEQCGELGSTSNYEDIREYYCPHCGARGTMLYITAGQDYCEAIPPGMRKTPSDEKEEDEGIEALKEAINAAERPMVEAKSLKIENINLPTVVVDHLLYAAREFLISMQEAMEEEGASWQEDKE